MPPTTPPYFPLPPKSELEKAGSQERMDIFRRYFASSRYNRLIIQQSLVRSASDGALASRVVEMEKRHNEDFYATVQAVREAGYFDEFLAAVREEDEALQKIIEAYDKRMSSAAGQ